MSLDFVIEVLANPAIPQTSSNIDQQNAINLISTLVKGEAAIFAIVISLSLVAIQLASSSYSPRVIKIIKRDLFFWGVVVLYVLSIILGVSGLRIIELLQNDYFIDTIYILGVLCFLSLIPYVWHILGILQPSKIIDDLSKDINEKTIDVISLGSIEDTIQPITDIIIRSMTKFEESTTIKGLRSLSDRVDYLLKNVNLKSAQQENIANLISYHFTFIGVNAANMQNDYITKLVIQKLEIMGLAATQKKYQVIAKDIASSLERIGSETSEKDMSNIACRAIRTIGNIGIAAISEKLDEAACQAAESLGELGRKVAIKKMGAVTYQAVNSLRENGLKAIKTENMQSVTEEIVSSLGLIGVESEEYFLEGAASQAIFSLGSIGREARIRDPNLVISISKRLDTLIEVARKQGSEILEKKCTEAIKKITE